MNLLEEIKFNEAGLVPAVAQDYFSKEVLMLAYMNKEALKISIETGKACYYSRSRETLWVKGETSGNVQLIKEIKYDCDCDTILLMVEQTGNACHTGNRSCFYRTLDKQLEDKEEIKCSSSNGLNTDVLNELYNTVLERKQNPAKGSYTNYLFDKGIDKILKKVGEENAEVIIAAKNTDKEELIYETADLLYHLSVLLAEKDIDWQMIFNELNKRKK